MAVRLRKAILVLVALLLGGLGNYEMVAKAPVWLGGPAPGWRAARRAERSVHYRPLTGIPPLDRLLHEGDEAAVYYASLLH